MKTKQTTKHALWASVTAIALCMVMLVGTTFAWFTDTASTAVNKIQSGTLKIGLEMSTDGQTWEDANGKTLNFLRKDANGNLASDENILWEPGCTYQLPQLRVVNKGNLAVKFTFKVSGIDGSAKLLKALEWNISELPEDGYFHLGAAQSETEFTASTSISISAHMKEDAGNEYQNETITGIGITVLAVQDTVEYDSNGKTYDQNADSTPDNPNWETNTSASGTVSNDGATLKDNEAAPTVTVKVPAGAVAENTALTLTKKLTDNGSITVGSGENATTYEVKLTDASGDVTAASGFFTVDLMIGKNLSVTKFLHDGDAMTLATSKDEVGDGTYSYDATTGYVTFGTTHFSPFTAVYKFSGGLGTEEAPYLIGTEKDWNAIADNKGENVYFKQIADLSVSKPVSSFVGTYDGGNHKLTTTAVDAVSNTSYLFYEISGHATFQNIHVTMTNTGISLLDFADWATNYGADFKSITFTGPSEFIQVNTNDFGFVVSNALYTSETGGKVAYNFENITVNVNLQNLGTCTGVILGYSPYFNAPGTVNYKNCVNNGSVIGAQYAGFLSGNPSWGGVSALVANTTITAVECVNNGSITGMTMASVLPINSSDKYSNLVVSGTGSIQVNNGLHGATLMVSQTEGRAPVFSVSGNSLSNDKSYKMVLSVGAKYWTKDGQDWDNNDIQLITNKQWEQAWDISNGLKYTMDIQVASEGTASAKTFTAQDTRTAGDKATGLDFNADGYALVIDGDKNYMVFDTTGDVYINSSVTVYIYEFTEGQLTGAQKISN